MARSLTTKIELRVTATSQDSREDAGESGNAETIQIGDRLTKTLTQGTGASLANRGWESKDRALADTISEDIDLYDFGSINIGAGAGKDCHGDSLALTGIKGLYVFNHADSVGNLLVGGIGATTAWMPLFNSNDDAELVIHPGGGFAVFTPTAAGYAVADTTNHLLHMLASGGAVTYDITVIGIQ